MNPNVAPWMIVVRRLITGALILIALFYSYSHTAQWFREQGQEEGAQVLAFLPELGLILVILTLVTAHLDQLTRAVLVVVGVSSLAITLTGNLWTAGPGPMGWAAALVAPLFSALFFTLEVRSLTSSGEPVAQLSNAVQINNTVQVAAQFSSPAHFTDPEPVQLTSSTDDPWAQVSPTEPVQVQVQVVEEVSRPAQLTSGSRWSPERAAAQQWAAQQDVWPTPKLILAQFPTMSPATVKRIKPDKTA